MTDRLERAVDTIRQRVSTPGRRTRTTVVLGRMLGLLIVVCFATGLYSHLLQHPPPWFPLLPQPFWTYRLTQGVHVVAGSALVPVLLGKLWSVYPRLFVWPPVTGVRSLLERLSIAVLVSTALLQVALGLMNIAQWYPFPFSFPRTHFALAWVLMGSVLLHVAVKLPLIVAFWRTRPPAAPDERGEPVPSTRPDAETVPHDTGTDAETISRRGALIAVGAATGAIVLGTAGQTVPALTPLALLAPRRPGLGPQGLPINRTAREAGISSAAVGATWRLVVASGSREVSLSLADVEAMGLVEVDLPIACVEGWSQMARWSGVRIRDVVALVGERGEHDLRIESLQQRGAYAVTTMQREYVADPTTLVATRLAHETLDMDHGYPARLIAPGRPGVLQTKWLSRIEVIA